MANDPQKPDPKDAKIAELEAKLAAKPAAGGDMTALGAVIADALSAALIKANAPAHIKALRRNFDGPGGTHLVAPEHRGQHTYRIGPSGHVRGNRRYEPGELITVTSERPAKDWVEVDADEKPKAKGAADQSVG